jgi:hypothetical protein
MGMKRVMKSKKIKNQWIQFHNPHPLYMMMFKDGKGSSQSIIEKENSSKNN